MILAAFIFWGFKLHRIYHWAAKPYQRLWAGTIALSLNSAAYIAEIVRGGIKLFQLVKWRPAAVLVSLMEKLCKIILPQATKLMLPNFVPFVIALKDTTIVSAIGLVELFQTGKIIIARNYQSFKMYAILAIFYLIIITLLTRLAKGLEKEDSLMAKLKIEVNDLHKQYGKIRS